MTLKFEKGSIVQLSNSNLADSRLKIDGGRATRVSLLRGDNRL